MLLEHPASLMACVFHEFFGQANCCDDGNMVSNNQKDEGIEVAPQPMKSLIAKWRQLRQDKPSLETAQGEVKEKRRGDEDGIAETEWHVRYCSKLPESTNFGTQK